MARHGIDEALLAAAAPHRDEVATCRIPVADPYSAGKARLLAWTASALRCGRSCTRPAGGRVAAVTVLGFASDRARVELLYTSLLLQASTQLARQRPAWAGESVAAYRRSWLHGFAVRVHQRLVEAEARAAESAAVSARRRRRPRGRRWRWCSPIAARGSTGLRRGVPADRPGPAGAAVRVGLRGGRPRRARADLGGRAVSASRAARALDGAAPTRARRPPDVGEPGSRGLDLQPGLAASIARHARRRAGARALLGGSLVGRARPDRPPWPAPGLGSGIRGQLSGAERACRAAASGAPRCSTRRARSARSGESA